MFKIRLFSMLSEIRAAFFKFYYLCRGFWGLPRMTDKEIKIFKDVFNSFGEKKINVFEWGCGHSSIYFARHLISLGKEFDWHAVDNSKKWYEKIKTHVIRRGLSKKVHLYLLEFTPFWLKAGWKWGVAHPRGFEPREKNEREYICFPQLLGIKFDVIIIDGRFRRRCLIVAQKQLAQNGIVILHDAQKERYHSSFVLYKHSVLCNSDNLFFLSFSSPDKIWIGCNDEFLDGIKEACK